MKASLVKDDALDLLTVSIAPRKKIKVEDCPCTTQQVRLRASQRARQPTLLWLFFLLLQREDSWATCYKHGPKARSHRHQTFCDLPANVEAFP
jgi:hypothetical protein